MLFFDDTKKLEKAIGEEATAVIAQVFEKADEKWRQDLATKADLQEMRNDLIERIAEVRVEMLTMKNDILRWVAGGFIAQTALLAALLSFLR